MSSSSISQPCVTYLFHILFNIQIICLCAMKSYLVTRRRHQRVGENSTVVLEVVFVVEAKMVMARYAL